MKYILTKEELDGLVSADEVDRRDKALEVARELILKVSGHKCDFWREYKCVECPIGRPKSSLDRDIRNLICGKSKSYPK